MTSERILLNNLLLTSVLVTFAAWTAIQFLGLGAFGDFGLWGIGRATAVLEILLISSLLLNAASYRRASRTTFVVFAWIPWVLLSVTFYRSDGFVEWVLSGPFHVLLWPLTYLFFYSQARAHSISVQHLGRYFLALSFACVGLFFATFATVNAGRTAGLQQVNAVYYPLLTLPWVAVSKRPLWRAAGALLIVVAVSYSLKRTAFVALAGAAIVYALVEVGARSKTSSRMQAALRLSALLGLAGGAYLYVNDSLGNAFSERLLSAHEDGGSDRLVIYGNIIQGVQASDVRGLVLGHGHGSSLEAFGITAHNDFLEVVYDYGVVGVLLYCLLHGTLMRKAFVLIRRRSPYASAFALSYALFLAMSMTSHLIIYPTYFAFLASFWGAIEGVSSKKPRSHSEAV
jgi:hypothetical protein